MKTVLFADDNQDMRELIELIMKNSGYNLITTDGGIEAVKICLEQKPDLVLMDLNMSDMNGFDATRALRDKGFSNPIVVLTGSESEDDRRTAEEAGCNEYILKTLEMEDVEKTVDRYLYEATGLL